ncbi:autotransporter outer membrane beta-barrel domain-containing protein, partial [Paraburkholderia aspalathi]|nr:autotransporter outer membrane beta-barrel domain-containing protein [Paraburkholderia aspalathi]
LDGIGTLTIANDGLAAVGDGVGGAGTVYLGRGALGFGTINIGGAAGEAPTGAGSLVAASVNFGEGMGTLNFNHTSFMTFASALTSTGSSGTHALNHYAGTTLLTGDSSGFSGGTTVSGGTLLVGGNNGNSKLGGSVTVTTGGTLGGYGTIGSGTGSMVTLGAGSIVAPGLVPGNSIGTLTINGDLTLAAGAIYQAGIGSSGGSDRIDVSGTARVTDGHVVVTMLDSETSYQYGQTYTILNAAGGVSGQFADAITQSAFLDLLLSHRANTVDLIVQLKKKSPDPDKPDPVKLDPLFGTVAETNNQFSTAATLDTLAQTGSSLALYNKLLMLDASTARAAFDSLSGEIHASAKTALIEDSRFIRNAANDRIRAAFDGVGASAAPVLAYGPDGAALATTNTERFAAWGSGFGNWGAANSDGNAAKFKHDTGGFLVGADGFVTDNWRLGLLTGYSHTSFNVKDRAASGSSDNYHLGLYGGTRWGNLGFRSGLAYTWHNVETGRSVAFPGFSDSLEADYSAGTFQAF